MKKQEFLSALAKRLSGLPKQETEERLHFYSEMIDDRMEDGISEEEAVQEVGEADRIAEQILAEAGMLPIPNKGKKPLHVWTIVLLVLGSPIWFSLLVAAFAIVFSLYVSLWSVIISLWAVFASLIACGICGFAVGVGYAVTGNGISGVAMIAVGCICTGLAIFFFLCTRLATKGAMLLTKKLSKWVKSCFTKGREQNA